MQLFKLLNLRAGEPKTTAELASSSHADPALLGRILRHLAAKGVIAEVPGDADSYGATELSETLASPEGSSGIRHVATFYTPIFQHVPDFLKSIDYRIPWDNCNGPFQHTMGRPGEWGSSVKRLLKLLPTFSTFGAASSCLFICAYRKMSATGFLIDLPSGAVS